METKKKPQEDVNSQFTHKIHVIQEENIVVYQIFYFKKKSIY